MFVTRLQSFVDDVSSCRKCVSASISEADHDCRSLLGYHCEVVDVSKSSLPRAVGHGVCSVCALWTWQCEGGRLLLVYFGIVPPAMNLAARSWGVTEDLPFTGTSGPLQLNVFSVPCSGITRYNIIRFMTLSYEGSH